MIKRTSAQERRLSSDTVVESLSTLRQERDGSDVKQIPCVDASQLSYETWWKEYMFANKPVIISGITADWGSRGWVRPCETCNRIDCNMSRPDLELLEKMFGEDDVSVAYCAEKYFSDQRREDMKLKDFLKEWKEVASAQGCAASCSSEDQDSRGRSPADELGDLRQAHGQVCGGLQGLKLPYCKDWHMARLHPGSNAYQLPSYFSEDWLNDYWDGYPALGDDYRFCYLGPRGTWTPLHRDVLRSYSWSANIVGRKLWILYSPSQEEFLKNRRGDLVWDVLNDVDRNEFPQFDKAQAIYVVQRAGEAIFVPSGWLHQVVNLVDCLSINHNWINSCNIQEATRQMIIDHQLVKASISDCSHDVEFPSICERMLNAHAGMNFQQYHHFLSHTASNELASLQSGSSSSHEGDIALGC
uniref:JmjC domain-containing protein n=1 Tax=Guillardia theta TaxID=55529 RepID=A0A6U5Z5M4_GUITH